MSLSLRTGGLSAACVVVVALSASAADLSQYREFSLGNSVAKVTAVTQTTERDMKTLHRRPALLQEVAWQPRYMTGAPVADRKSIDQVVFSFVDDQLFKMTVAYERDGTSGLTNADMITALTQRYGPPTSLTPKSAAGTAAVDAVNLAEWQQADVQVVLWRSRYNDAYSLVITSLSLQAAAGKARATALVMDAREAPEREAALSKKRADEKSQVEEQARTVNKKVFQP